MKMNNDEKQRILRKTMGLPWIKKNAITRTNKIIDAYLYADISTIDHVEHFPILTEGAPGFGKTSLINRLIRRVDLLFPKVEKNTLFTNSMRYDIDHMDKKKIQLLVVDDAIELQDSSNYMSSDSKKTAHDFFKIRHIYEEINPDAEVDGAIIFTILGTQSSKALDPRLRQARMVFYKNTYLDKEKNKYLQYQIGRKAFKWLDSVTDRRSALESIYAQYFVLKIGGHCFKGAFKAPKNQLKCQYINPISNVKDEKLLEFAKIAAMRTNSKVYTWEKIQEILKNEENPVTFRTRFSADLKKFLKKFDLETKNDKK